LPRALRALAMTAHAAQRSTKYSNDRLLYRALEVCKFGNAICSNKCRDRRARRWPGGRLEES
jgi:hypothetical protein